MELRIIGTSAAFPGRNDACSSYLLDAGPGSLAAIQEFTGYADLSGKAGWQGPSPSTCR